MEQDEPSEEKKIWVDPELTFMPMEKVKAKSPDPVEHTPPGDDATAAFGS